MKINDISKVYGVYESKPTISRQAPKTKAQSGFDKLSLSSDAKDFQAVMRGLKEAPDIREDKVREISEKYENSHRYPDYREVAGVMLNSGVFRNIGYQQR